MLRQRWTRHFLVILAGLMVFALLATSCSQSQGQPQNAQPAAKSEAKSEAKTEPKAEPKSEAKSEPKTEASSQADLEFYKGKTVTFIVATKPGGGYDAYARLIAPFLQKNLPGSTVIVKNVDGAGHIIGANEIYNAQPDGLTLGMFNKGLIVAQLNRLEGIKFDLAKFVWLGNAAREPRALVIGTKTPYKTVDDLKKSDKEIKLAGAGFGSESSNDALMLGNILGIKVKVINGYAGQEADLAMMRGEIEGQVGTYSSMTSLLDQKEARVILTIGSANVAGAPNLRDLAPADKKALAALMESQAELGRVIAATPGIPEGRAKALREAVQKSLADPDLLAKAKQSNLPIDAMSAEETTSLVKAALNQSPDMIKLINDIAGAKK